MRSPNDFLNFKAIKEISKSNYGTVSIIVDNSDQTKQYRKKEIKSELSQQGQQAISKYIETLYKLEHPSINKIYGIIHPSNYAIISDFEPNNSLEDILEEVRSGAPPIHWNPTNKMKTIFGVASAMMYIHGSRMIHRNLKPSNVLFNENFDPKICDFYFSKFDCVSGQNSPKEKYKISESNININGSFSWYTAPELMTQQHTSVSNKVDIYSFAFLLYEIFTGDHPKFKNVDDPNSERSKIIKGERPQIPKTIPRPYRELIEKCWSQESTDRPSFKKIVKTLMDPHYILKTTDIECYTEFTKTTIHSNFLVRESSNEDEDKDHDDLLSKAKNGDPEAQFQYHEMEGGLSSPRVREGKPPGYLKMAADAGHIKAMYTQAQILYNDKQFEEAISYFKKAADLGHRDSMYSCAMLYLKNESLEEAAKYFKMAADKGDIDAQNQYGKLVLEMKTKAKNEIEEEDENYEETALTYFKMAADNGDCEAQYNYSDLLSLMKKGKENNTDLLNITTYLSLSADQGYFKALNRLADISIDKGDVETAVNYFKRSAESGDPIGQRNYAKHIINSKPEEAKKYLKLSADQGDLEAQKHYALILQKDPQTRDLSEKYLKMAADQGDSSAQLAIAIHLRDSLSLNSQEDLKSAAEYFQKAAEQGIPEAQDALGVMLRDGKGLAKNTEEASKLFLKAASLGNADAMANYAVLLLSTKPKPEPGQIAEAREYLERSVAKSSVLGKAQLAAILRYEDPERALKLATESAEQECSAGQYLLAMMNEEKGLEFKELLQSAADKGNADAMHRLSEIRDDRDLLKKAADRGSTKACVQYSMLIKNEKLDEAILYLNNAAEAGDPTAEYHLALLLDSSLNPEKSLTLLRKAADQRYAPALNELGERYLKQMKFEEAKKVFRTSKRLGDPLGQVNYGLLYKEGNGVPCNYAKAYKYIKMSADQNFSQGQLQLAILTTDENESNKYFKLSAESGDNEARYYYGTILLEKQNITEALKYLKLAAKSGHEDSQFLLAAAYQNGEGIIPKNYKKALKYYKMLIERPNPKAASLFNYSLMLKNGLGISPNIVEAAKYLRMAALQGDAEAQNNYALMLEKGEGGTAKNLEEAAHYFKLAADQGNSYAQNNYGVMLKSGSGVERNIPLAFKMFKLSADQENLNGMTSLANMLRSTEYTEYSTVVKHDLTEALRLYKTAADGGNNSAQLSYGQMLVKGEGTVKDVENGLKYIRMAISSGNLNAMNFLGQMYKTGDENGIEKNMNEAAKMFMLSAKGGNSTGMYNFATILKEGNVIQDDPIEINGGNDDNNECAMKYFEMAAEKGNVKALNSLGFIYYKGEGVQRNKEKALHYFERAAALGNKRAIKNAQLIREKMEEKK